MKSKLVTYALAGAIMGGSATSYSQDSNYYNQVEQNKRDVYLKNLIDRVFEEGKPSSELSNGEIFQYQLRGPGSVIYSLQDTNTDQKFNKGDFFTIKPHDLPTDSSQLERCFYEITLVPHPEKQNSFDISTQLCDSNLSPQISQYSGLKLDVENHSKDLELKLIDYYTRTYLAEK